MRVDLSKFQADKNFDRGASTCKMIFWYISKMLFFLTPFPWPYFVKNILLRMFGAKIGKGVIIKPRVNIHFPWKLVIGDHCWIGEEVLILNFEKIQIGSHCCVSQRTFLCSGNHDYRDESMSYHHAPISVEDGVWIGAQCFIAPGVKIGEECVVTVGSVVVENLPSGMICSGNPAGPIKERWP